MPAFTPPVEKQSIPGSALWSRIGTRVGVSVVKSAGRFQTVPYPALIELDPLTEGFDYFLGGRTYEISDAIADALVADGYVVQVTGFNSNRYGYGPFGGGGVNYSGLGGGAYGDGPYGDI